MINLKIAAYFTHLITFFLAYLIAVPIAGAFRAWVAAKMGDYTAEDEGFLTLNPIVHIDPFGVLCIALVGFGWGKYVPINPYNIVSPFRGLKLVTAYFSNVFIHIVMAIVWLTVLIWWFDVNIIQTVYGAHSMLSYAYPFHSTLSLTVARVLVALISLHVLLSVLSLLINGFMLAMFYITGGSSRYEIYSSFIMMFALFAMIWLFGDTLYILLANIISYAGLFLARLMGIV